MRWAGGFSSGRCYAGSSSFVARVGWSGRGAVVQVQATFFRFVWIGPECFALLCVFCVSRNLTLFCRCAIVNNIRANVDLVCRLGFWKHISSHAIETLTHRLKCPAAAALCTDHKFIWWFRWFPSMCTRASSCHDECVVSYRIFIFGLHTLQPDLGLCSLYKKQKQYVN